LEKEIRPELLAPLFGQESVSTCMDRKSL